MNFCINRAASFDRKCLVGKFVNVQRHRENNAGDDKLSDRPVNASGGGCREVILIVPRLRTSVRTHMFMWASSESVFEPPLYTFIAHLLRQTSSYTELKHSSGKEEVLFFFLTAVKKKETIKAN